MDFPWISQLLQLRRFELRRLEETHGAEQRCAMLQARCRSLEQDQNYPGFEFLQMCERHNRHNAI